MNQVSYPQLRQELIAMAKADQNMRTKAIHNKEAWDNTLDIKNTERLKTIIAQYGWPTIQMVGAEASNDAWLIAQHSDHDHAFQKDCLRLLKKLSKDEVSLHNIAYLEDRLLIACNKKQLYGTQFDSSGSKLRPLPIKDPLHVDMRRKRMGLGALSEYTKTMQEMHSTD